MFDVDMFNIYDTRVNFDFYHLCWCGGPGILTLSWHCSLDRNLHQSTSPPTLQMSDNTRCNSALSAGDQIRSGRWADTASRKKINRWIILDSSLCFKILHTSSNIKYVCWDPTKFEYLYKNKNLSPMYHWSNHWYHGGKQNAEFVNI